MRPCDYKDFATSSPIRCSLVQSRRDFAMTIVNNVTRLLDSRKIQYTAYELPPEKLGALEAAQFLNVEPASVFKTIVVTSEKPKKPLLVVVSSTSTVDLKLLASALGEKKVYLPTEREAEQLTGLQAGGISPLALINKGFQVVIDSSSKNLIEIYISGGQRGLNIKIPVADLVKLTNARIEAVSRPALNEHQ
jgi:Cys-tRNA(Pro)/Cys-tRNA(Cys) deacylase